MQAPDKTTSFKQLVTYVKQHEAKCALLIGAGCSKSANFPLADDIVRSLISDPKYYSQFDSLKEEEYSYSKCMGALSQADRHEVISALFKEMRLNWAHICIAQLMEAGVVDRVLTTNFDPLVMQACALINQFPAIYDMTGIGGFKAHRVKDQAIFHLHGQRDGFAQLHEDTEFQALKDRLRPLFEDTNNNRVWIVVGYSGRSDPVFERLVELPEFGHRLYWVSYKDTPLHEDVSKKLIKARPNEARWIPGFDADEFFMRLAAEFDCFSPPYLDTPFSHLQNLLNGIVEPEDHKQSKDLMRQARKNIDDAIQQFEREEDEEGEGASASEPMMLVGTSPEEVPQRRKRMSRSRLLNEARNAIFSDEPERAVRLLEKYPKQLNHPEVRGVMAFALTQVAIKLDVQALTVNDVQQKLMLIQEALSYYPRAHSFDQSSSDLFYDWGVTLNNMAELPDTPPEEARKLNQEAIQKYQQALDIKPDDPLALINWGSALNNMARLPGTPPEEARKLSQEAIQKLQQALAIKPDDPYALNNWGNALNEMAGLPGTPPEEAREMNQEAIQKYQQALDIKPDDPLALNNWGYALYAMAGLPGTPPGEARKLFQEAIQNLQQALAIKPDSVEALNNWGNALNAMARLSGTPPDVACKLHEEAIQKYQQALAIKPDYALALNNWGNALYALAGLPGTPPEEARKLNQEAIQKYQQTLDIKPDFVGALNNWGNALYAMATLPDTPPGEARKLYQKAIQKYQQALATKPEDSVALTNWGNALIGLARLPSTPPEEARKLNQEAIQKYQQALDIKPDAPDALNNWGTALNEMARLSGTPPVEARKLYDEAIQKHQQALVIKPNYAPALNNWGTAIVDIACLPDTTAENRQVLLTEAESFSSKAETLEKGGGSLSLARIAAVRGQEDQAKEWLENRVENVSRSWPWPLETDPAFASVKDKPWFQEILAKAKGS
jgi:tetratricopeptide (TPR) repeat protein/NAD-dependent SIR2 family protein deacetylase